MDCKVTIRCLLLNCSSYFGTAALHLSLVAVSSSSALCPNSTLQLAYNLNAVSLYIFKLYTVAFSIPFYVLSMWS
uniref:Uncharacterized protein n=1 Tax=Pararge aegeria TaxID=116150 RepID=S4NSL0_9NEOP